jgi:hypothetical protein
MQPYRPNYLLISYLSIITLSFFIVYHGKVINSSIKIKYPSTPTLSVIILCMAVIPLSVPILHLAKSYLSNGIYDNHHKTLEVLNPIKQNYKQIFITTAQLLPLFSDDIYIDFKNVSKLKHRRIHWYFPVANSPGDKFKKLIFKDIESDKNLMANSLWGALNKTTIFDKSMSMACLTLKGGVAIINLHKPKVVFKDKQNIFLTSSKVTPSNKCLIDE